jgi:uncharacterized membrane protein
MRKRNSSALYLTRGAIIAALYVVLTYISAIFGLSSGVIQFRISEALCILPIFFPEAVPGLYVGCVIANLIAAANPWDILFGSLATLIGAFGARLLRRLPDKLMWIATLPTVVANAIIVPPILIFAYGAPDAYWFILLTVTVGELISAGVLGYILYLGLVKSKINLRI